MRLRWFFPSNMEGGADKRLGSGPHCYTRAREALCVLLAPPNVTIQGLLQLSGLKHTSNHLLSCQTCGLFGGNVAPGSWLWPSARKELLRRLEFARFPGGFIRSPSGRRAIAPHVVSCIPHRGRQGERTMIRSLL
jgi:hypothetical protein